MPVQLSSTSSIVDFLNNQKKPSDFGSRGTLFKSSGLDSRLGTYVGSAAQNQALLKSLQSPSGEPGALLKAPTPTVPDFSRITQGVNLAPATSALTAARPPVSPVSTPAPTPIQPAIQPAIAPQPSPQPTQPAAPATVGISGITAEQAAASIPQIPSADEILNSILSSAGFQNFQQGSELTRALDIGEAQSQKAQLERDSAANTKSFIDSMGKRGLFFSGETTTGLQSLAENLASSKFDVDRRLAGELLRSDLKTKEEIINQVSGIVKDAQQGRKEAISALEKVGLTVIGDQVVPTLAAQSAERAQASAELAATREVRIATNQAAQLELSQARFELSEAKGEQQMEIALARLDLAEQRAEDAKTDMTASERKAQSAIGLYGSTLKAVLQAGLTPQDALDAANQQANVTGVILGVEEQNAILTEAQRLLGSGEVKPTPQAEAEPAKGFFSRLFGS